MIFGKTIQNLKRTREILGVLLKYGLEDLVSNTSLQNLITKNRKLKWLRDDKPILDYTRWERIRLACEDLGPTFIKFGQVLSNRPDLLPDDFIIELQKLQSEVPPFPFNQVKSIIEEELKLPLADIFSQFDEKPVGSASIGQVYKAILADGRQVVVKVRRPGVAKRVRTDLLIIRDLVNRAEHILERNGIVNAIDAVDAFERSIQKELDYTNEARNISTFKHAYRNYKKFYVPSVYKEFSTSKVLVMEFVDGCKITDVVQLAAWGLDPPLLAEMGMDIYLTQIFEHGFFHADPHPGNIIITNEGTICLIDFGMIGTLMRKDKYALAGVFVGMAQQNARFMAENLRKLALEAEITDMRALEYDLNELIEDFALLDVSESNIAEMSSRLQKITYNYRLRIPGSVFIIFRALAILEGIGKAIHPNFQTYEFIKPFGAKLIREKLSKDSLTDDLLERFTQLGDFLTSFPVEVRDILVQTRKGKLRFQHEPVNYHPILNSANRAVNRVVLSLIICSLLIAAAIMFNAQFPAWYYADNGLPYFSLVAIGLALMFGLVLWRMIQRTNEPD